MNNLKNQNTNDNFTFQTMPSIDTNPDFHNHLMSTIKTSHHHIANTVDQYSKVSAQLKSTFNQIFNSRQSISSTSSSSSSNTDSSLPSSIELIVQPNENLFKSADGHLKSEELIIESKNQSLLGTHDNLFRCLSITDESLEFDDLNNLNLISSSSSLDSSSFENIYSLYTINRTPNSINKSKTTQELNEQNNIYERLKTKRRSLCDKKLFNNHNELDSRRHYLIKESYSKDNESLNCKINLIELNLKNRKSLTISIKWPLKTKLNTDKKFSIQFRKLKDDNELLNVHIKY